MNTIFISYRRDDSGPTAGRMFDSLSSYFGRDAVFKDVDSIPVGAQFPHHLASVLQQCSVTLVIIGSKWLTITDAQSHRRLDAADDFVRIEVETALKSGMLVIPVAVDGARMPSSAQLPASIRGLGHLNATQVRPDPDYHSDMARLIKIVEHYLVSRSTASEATPLPAQYQPTDAYTSAGRMALGCVGGVVLAVVAVLLALVGSVYLILR